jgi:hypothetical protein
MGGQSFGIAHTADLSRGKDIFWAMDHGKEQRRQTGLFR